MSLHTVLPEVQAIPRILELESIGDIGTPPASGTSPYIIGPDSVAVGCRYMQTLNIQKLVCGVNANSSKTGITYAHDFQLSDPCTLNALRSKQ